METSSPTAPIEFAFDVGHSSIGWAVLQAPLNSQPSTLNLLGCGAVTFGADDCLASKRRDYRRQRRHARSTRQRIARMEQLLAHLGVLTAEQLTAKHQQGGGHSAPWLLAARVLASDGAKEHLLDWPALWDVLRWYAHNRGYDGNRRWSEADSTAAAEDTEKEQHAIALMTENKTETMAETLCAALGLKPMGDQQASRKNFKRLNAAFPRRVVEAEVRRLLDSHMGKLPKLDDAFIKALMEDWTAIPVVAAVYDRRSTADTGRRSQSAATAIKLPARYSGGLLFGQLVPRFDNRIITRCPVTFHEKLLAIETETLPQPEAALLRRKLENAAKRRTWSEAEEQKLKMEFANGLSKVPDKKSPEFLRYRWAMQLANIQVAPSSQERLRKLPVTERQTLHALMQAKGALTEGELKRAVRALPGVARDNLDTMLMHPDAKEALVFDPVQKLLASAELAPFWATLPPDLQARFRGKLRHGNAITLADLRAALTDPSRRQREESPSDPEESQRLVTSSPTTDGLPAFDTELQRQLDALNTRKAKKQAPLSRDAFLAQSFDARKALARLSGRAPYARPLLQQAYEQVLAGKDPREDGGCLFRSEEIRHRELHKKLEDQTNNHLVRHRLLILERLLKDLVNAPEFAAGKPARVSQVTIEVNRDLREMSGMTNYQKESAMRDKLKDFKSVVAKLEDLLPSEFHSRINGTVIRKARVASDLNWKCPYTGVDIQPIHLVTGQIELDHVIPYAERASNSLDSLVATFCAVNRMKRKRSAFQFVTEEQLHPVQYSDENGTHTVDGFPKLHIRPFKEFEQFVKDLDEKKGHSDDKRRKKRRKDLLLLPKFEDKGFVPRDLTLTSQLVRLGAQVIQRFFCSGGLRPPSSQPDAQPQRSQTAATGGGPRIISLPGAVTGAVRKGWRVLGCLSQAAPQILEPTGEPKSKTDIRDLTHLHHALDACVLALASHYFPKDGSLWEAMVVRSPDAQQKQRLHATGFYEWDSADKPHLKDLPVELKQQIANRLAEKRVVQHIPADMSGMKVDQTYYRAVVDRNEVSRVPQRIRRRLEAKKRLIKILTLRLNRLSAKTDRAELAKSIEGHREELQWWLNAEKSAWVLHRVRWTADAGQKLIEGMKKYRAYIRGVIQAKRPPQKPNLIWPLGAKGQSSFLVYELLPREKLLGVLPKQPETSKLKPQKSVMTFSDNFGVAILDHATNPDDKFVIIPWHKVWHRIEELKQKNLHANGKGTAPKVLRIGVLVHVANPRNSQYAGIWMIRGVQANQRDGWLVDVSRPDTIDCRKHGKLNVRLLSLIEGGLEILKPSLCGVAQAPPAAGTP